MRQQDEGGSEEGGGGGDWWCKMPPPLADAAREQDLAAGPSKMRRRGVGMGQQQGVPPHVRSPPHPSEREQWQCFWLPLAAGFSGPPCFLVPPTFFSARSFECSACRRSFFSPFPRGKLLRRQSRSLTGLHLKLL